LWRRLGVAIMQMAAGAVCRAWAALMAATIMGDQVAQAAELTCPGRVEIRLPSASTVAWAESG
jgi:hypothetical protein